MATCPYCNTECAPKWSFCPTCGHTLAISISEASAAESDQSTKPTNRLSYINTPKHKRIAFGAILLGLIWLVWPASSTHHNTHEGIDTAIENVTPTAPDSNQVSGVDSGIWDNQKTAELSADETKSKTEPASVKSKLKHSTAPTSAQNKSRTTSNSAQQPVEIIGRHEESELDFAEKLLGDQEYSAAISLARNTFRNYPNNARALSIISRAEAASKANVNHQK